MTAHAFEWRQVPARPVIEESPPPPSLFDGLDATGLAATLGPAMARLAGCRISARLDAAGSAADPAAQWLHIARIGGTAASARIGGTAASARIGGTAASARIGGTAASAGSGGPPVTSASATRAPAPPRTAAQQPAAHHPQRQPATEAGSNSIGQIDLFASPGLVAALAELLFGGRPAATDPAQVQALPPGSASWTSIAQQLAAIATQALRANGLALPHGPVEVPARPSPAAIAHGAALLPLSLALEGGGGRLLLADNSCIPPIAPEAPPPPDPRVWRRLAQTRTMDVDLPVALRLEDLHLPLTQVSALAPGDIIPISRPRQFAMMVGGQRVGTIAADRIGRTDSNAQEKP